MSSSDHIRERFNAAVAGNDVQAVLALYHEAAVLTVPEGRFEGRDYLEAYYRPQFTAFPDGGLTVLATHDGEDVLITEWSFSGTHTGPLELPGGELMAPTGRRVSQRGADVAIIDGGLIREHRVYYDQLEAMEQLGALDAVRSVSP